MMMMVMIDDDQQVLAVVDHFASRSLPIASICHGQLLLVAADAVAGE